MAFSSQECEIIDNEIEELLAKQQFKFLNMKMVRLSHQFFLDTRKMAPQDQLLI